MLYLVNGQDTERTRLALVKRKSIPFPPEPFRWFFIRPCQWAIKSVDEHEGRRNPWLRTVDLFGDGFDSWKARTPAATAGVLAWRCHNVRGLLLGTEVQYRLHLSRAQVSRLLPARHLLALDEVTDVSDDVGIGERGYVANVGEVRNRRDDSAHNLSRTGLGHVGHDPDILGSGDLSNLGLDHSRHLVRDAVGVGINSWLDGDVHQIGRASC